MKKKF